MQSSLASDVSPTPARSNWLGFRPASQQKIRSLESRLEVTLPPSYAGFLRISDGWRRTTSFIGRIRSASDVDWFRIENQQWIEAYSQTTSTLQDTEYFDYNENSAADFRSEDMRYLLQISDTDDGVYLLNPRAVTPDGEWEAWFFANWIPGARRFPTFAHLMVSEYRTFAELEEIEVSEAVVPRLPDVPPATPRISLNLPLPIDDEVSSQWLELIEEMSSSDSRASKKALRIAVGMLKGRPFAERRPELVQPLTELFNTSRDADVRQVCIRILTEVSPNGEAPPALFQALTDAHAFVVLSGMGALHYFPNSDALEPLCRFIESRQYVGIDQAMGHLGEMADPKAVPTLAGVLMDTETKRDQTFASAAIALACCGQPGFEVLVSALDHDDPRIRRAAVVGLDVSGNEAAKSYLDRAEMDPDPDVRQRAKTRVGKMPF